MRAFFWTKPGTDYYSTASFCPPLTSLLSSPFTLCLSSPFTLCLSPPLTPCLSASSPSLSPPGPLLQEVSLDWSSALEQYPQDSPSSSSSSLCHHGDNRPLPSCSSNSYPPIQVTSSCFLTCCHSNPNYFLCPLTDDTSCCEFSEFSFDFHARVNTIELPSK